MNTYSGELFFTEDPDLSLGGPLPVRFERYYGSFLEREGKVPNTALGPNWSHRFNWRLIRVGSLIVEVITWRGRLIRFVKDQQSGAWNQTSMSERPYQLVEGSSNFRLANPRTQRIYTFDSNGLLTKIEDGKGNQLTLTYNSSNQLTQVSDGLGRTLTFNYAATRLVSVSDGTRTVSFGYTSGLLTGATNPLGDKTTYEYDGGSSFTGLLTKKTRPEGNTPFTQTYDSKGRVATQTDAFNNTWAFNYSIDATTGKRTTTVTDPLSNTTKHVHDFRGRLLRMTDRNGNTINFKYTDAGQRKRITDRLGDPTKYTFDSAFRLPTSITDARGGKTALNYVTRSDEGFTFHDLDAVNRPDGTSISYSHDADGNVTSVTGPGGRTWTVTYNGRGQPLTVTNPEGGTWTYTYNNDGTLASAQDPAGNTTTYGYDGLRRLTSVNRPDGTSRTFSYDDADRLTSMTDEEGRTYQFSYDANGNLTTITDPSSKTVQRRFDAMDRLVDVTDRQGQTAGFGYDALGRLETMTDRSGNTRTFGYDAEGRLTSLTNGDGDTWTISRDAEGVPTALTNPAGETTTLTSNSMGWITQVTSPRGNTRGFSRDPMGRVTAVQNPSGGTAQLNRDDRGLLVGMTLPGGASASYNRDGLGLLEGRTGPKNGSWDSPRDALGRITDRTDPLGRSSTYSYDNRNRVSSVQQPGGLGTVTRSYDATNNLTGLSHSDGTSLNFNHDTNGRLIGATGVSLSRDAEGRITESNGLTVSRDPEGRIASIALPGGTVQYFYDGAGRLTKIEDWQGGVTSFSYDTASRLVKITRPNGTKTIYTYDADGRLVGIEEIAPDGTVLASSTLTRNSRGHVTRAERSGPLTPTLSSETKSFSHDAAGQVQSFGYDALGRRTDDGARTYSWDGLSRLKSYSNGTTTTSFTYDAFGNRLTKQEGGTTREYVWNYALGLPSVAVIKEGGTDQRYYVHTPGGRLLYSVDAADGSRRFYHFDEMGNTTLLTDDAGAVEGAFAYSPYGKVVAEQGGVETPFTWQGEYGVMAEGNGLYYMRARYYDAESRRFLSRDPVRSLRPDEITPYQYARGNPQQFVDPTGLQPDRSEILDILQNGDFSDLDPSTRERINAAVGFIIANNDNMSVPEEMLEDGKLDESEKETLRKRVLAWVILRDDDEEPTYNGRPIPTERTPQNPAPTWPGDWEPARPPSLPGTEDDGEPMLPPSLPGTDDGNDPGLRDPLGGPPGISDPDLPTSPAEVNATEYPVTVTRNTDEVAVGTVIVEERSTEGVSVHTPPGGLGDDDTASKLRDVLPLSQRQAHWQKLPEVFLESPR